jgi:hypothetical protein
MPPLASPLGRVLRSSTTTFTFGSLDNADLPAFGALVTTAVGPTSVYGLVYEVVIQDDPFVRQVVAAAGELTAERIEDMRQRRQVPVEITALTVAYRQDDQVYQRLPPRPPAALQPIWACDEAETGQVLADFAFFRTVLNAAHCPTEELLAAALRRAAACKPPQQQQTYLLEAGRELARLLAADLPRLDAILRRLAP